MRPGILRGLAIAAAVMLAALVLLLAWPLLSDLPRRWVESELAESLGAEVWLGRFEIHGWSHFGLGDLTIRQMESRPELVEARILELAVEASPRSVLSGEFSRLDFDGVSLRLAPPSRSAAPAPPTEIQVRVLEIRQGVLVIDGADSSSSLPFQGRIRNLGSDWSATLDAGPGHLDARALAELVPPPTPAAGADGESIRETGSAALPAAIPLPLLEGFHVGALLTHEGRWELSATTDEILVPDPGNPISLPFTAVEGRGELLQDGGWSVHLRPKLPGLATARADLVLSPSNLRLQKASASLRGLDLDLWLPILNALPPGAALKGRADAEIDGSTEEGWSYSLRARLSSGSLLLADQPIVIGESTLELDGSSSSEGRGPLRGNLAVSDLTTSALSPDLGELTFPMTVTLDGAVAWEESLTYAGRLGCRTRELGELVLEGSMANLPEAPMASASWDWSGVDLARLAVALEALPEEGPGVEGRISARGSLSGSIADPAVRGELALQGLRVAALTGPPSEAPGARDRSTSVQADRLVLPFDRPAGARRVDWSLREAPLLVTLPPIEPIVFQTAGQGSSEPAEGRLQIGSMILSSSGIATFTLSGAAEAGGAARIRVDVADGELGRWIELARPLLDQMALPPEIHGGISGQLSASKAPSGTWALRSEALLERAGASSADGARVVDGLGLRARVNGEAAPGMPWIFDGDLEATGPQALWGSLFGDYSHLRLGLDFQGRFQPGSAPAPTAVWSLEGRTRGLEGMSLGWQVGTDTAPEVDPLVALRLEVDDLAALAEQWLRRPLGDSLPALAELEVEGKLTARLSARRHHQGFDLSGDIDLRETTVRRASGLAVEGLALDLPYELHWPLGEVPPDDTHEQRSAGGLSFDSIRIGSINLAPTVTDLLIRGDSIELAESLHVPILGGAVILEKMTLAGLLRPSPHLEAAVRIQGIRLEEATAGLQGLPLAGELDGYFPRMRLGARELQVDGDAELSVFGGRVVVSDISGRDLFSRFPQLRLSAEFHDIDLARLTGRFDFGEMTGLAEGRLQDLELFGTTPVRFRGWVASVDEPRVPRKISVKAVSNVAQLAGGGGISVLERGAYRFLDEYTYRRFGVAMVLDRDHFLMRGLARRGDKELFVRGRPPFSLDMVNVEPGRTVSFSTMLDRISNLEIQR